ncbi:MULTISPECIES: enolase C-terminal domain-like protein [unclassified Haladaptatus]|uniref:enolase C-terminal domain-like protein n=1 Tax=unclassified Haladaptatus TaxID=2622732 RepID=UPI00209C6627|nr:MULTISPECIES: enolase C-terminal domain-like protein [unclassified Haladaptatus]MCO8243542.1 hypothetical protein [Haladaptatus sp. AB643]MCO8254951.1 hypothetical protein [Haladaptatus sp. AB618]
MAITISETELSTINLRRRMSFHFGNVHVTEGPQILVSLTADIDGRTAQGSSMGALAPMWFHKDPEMTLEDGIEGMLEVFEATCEYATAMDPHPTVFAYWQSLFEQVGDWAEPTDHPALLWSYGVSLIEQALIDAFCRATETTFPTAVHENTLGIEMGKLYDELDGRKPTELLPETPRREMRIRHTVGLSDPLTDEDVAVADRLDDGLPQSLTEYIEEQGVNHFKIKLAATPSDADRLRRIHALLERSSLDDYAFSLDANEQYGSVAEFRRQWETMQTDSTLEPFFDHLLYVEQPLPRDEAFSEGTRATFDAWTDRPPVIIDESDDHPTSLRTALDCGYAGTSHKNCKGVIKGLVNRCLIEHRRRTTDGTYLMSGEDLTTLGPVELGEDLATMATIGMDHVERNGHHYYLGLDMYSDDVQDQILENHGDLYRRHPNGFATLDIHDGKISLGSVLEAPFGYDIDLDASEFTPVAEWEIDSIYED